MATVEMQRLAKAAGKEVEAALLELMELGKQGEVAAVLGFNELEVESRPRDRKKRWKVQQGFSRVRAQT